MGTSTIPPSHRDDKLLEEIQPTRDYRDLVIIDLAVSEAALLERVASLEQDVTAYRELAQQAIHALADQRRQHRSVRDDHDRLRDHLRFIAEERWVRRDGQA
jgi:hypothetical protein